MPDAAPQPDPDAPGNRSPAGVSPGQLHQSLARLRTRAKAQLITQRAALLIAALLAYVLAAAAIDYVLRMPRPVRLVLWTGSLAGLLYLIRTYFRPALLFRPTLTQVALRVEQSPAGQEAGLRGLLASALELGSSADATNGSLTSELRDLSTAEARRRYGRAMTTRALLVRRRLGQGLGALALAIAPFVALSLTIPALSRIGAARVLTPWSTAAWPKRTGVLDANPVTAYAAGTALPLRAALTRASSRSHNAVNLTYRLITGGKPGLTQHAQLTGQNKPITVEAAPGITATGELFERLLDTTGMIPAHKPGEPPADVQLEYSFGTADDDTPPRTITLVEPPAILAGRVNVTPPAYAAAALAAQPLSPAALVKGEKDAGPGRDERAVIGPILAGSRLTLALTLSKDLPVPAAAAAPDPALRAWLAATLPGLDESADVSVQLAPAAWTLSFTALANVRLPVVLTDSYGIRGSDDAAYRFEVVEDRSPAAAIIDPAQDESILPTAVIEAAAEGRDDVALASVLLRTQVARPPSGSVGAPPDPQGEPATLATATPADAGAAVLVHAAAPLDIAGLKVVPGDEVWLTGEATDIYAYNSATHPLTISAKRRLRIISESELIEQVRSELSGVREAAKRLEQEQENLARQRPAAAADASKAAEQAARQDALTERMVPMADALKRLEARAQRNRLADKSLESLLKDASQAVNEAGEQSEKSSQGLSALAGNSPSQDRDADEKKVDAAQKAVEENLSQLADMLDRGQDTWAMRRAIEKALSEQQQLSAQTAAADPAAKGQKSEDLSQAQRDELEQLAQRQQEVAQRSAALMDALNQRAEQMKRVDAGQAQSMQNAADKARQQQLDKHQREAAQQIQQNKTDEAHQQQKQAEQSLQSMLDELDKGEQQKDTALRRVLADLMEGLDKLIKQQQGEITRLADAVTNNSPAPLDPGMISVNQNTLGVLTSAKAIREAVEVVGYLNSAAGAQSAAIVNLRAPDRPEADVNERISLARLTDAKAAAQKLDDDAAEREEQRKRDELKQAYREALELEVSLRADTTPLVGKDLGRRERQAVRGLATRQDAIRASLAELRSKTKEIAEAKVFDFAHARLDQSAAAASQALGAGEATTAVAQHQSTIIRLLQGLLDAVSEMDKKKDDFRDEDGGDDGGGGSGGGQQQPLIPPIAELKLLRAMQIEAAELTRAAADSADAAQTDTVTHLQRDLADQAKALLQRMNDRGEEKTPAHQPDTPPPPKGATP